MTNVSKQPMSTAELERLFNQLNTVINSLNLTSTNRFLTELLGHEERIMLAKRFAIIIMLNESYSIYQIANRLKVSTSTVTAIQTKLTSGSYDQLLSILSKDRSVYADIWKTLDTILHLGGVLPHYVGLDRYKNLH